MTTLNTQLGVANEVTYGQVVTPARFFEFTSESIQPDQARVQSVGFRRGQRGSRADRFVPYRKGAAGPFEFDAVLTKGFGFWLQHMLGTVATGTVTDGNYTHTATTGPLNSKAFTLQVNRPLNPSGTDQPFTFTGGKLTSWELACDVDGLLMAKFAADFKDFDTTTALATAAYPAGADVFSFVGATIEIGDVVVESTKFSVACDLKLKTDIRYLGVTAKEEPVVAGMRDPTWQLEMVFDNLDQFNRFRAAAPADALAKIEATFLGPVAHAGTTLPMLKFTLDAARFDSAALSVSNMDPLMLPLSGVALVPGSGDQIKIEYRTTDATP